MQEDEHHVKLNNHPCGNCGSNNTWMVDVVPEGDKEIMDSGIYCDDCKKFYV